MKPILHNRYELLVTQQTVSVVVKDGENRMNQMVAQMRPGTYFNRSMELVWNSTENVPTPVKVVA